MKPWHLIRLPKHVGFRQYVEEQLQDGETIHWQGSPAKGYTLTALQMGYYDAASGPINLYFIALVISLFISYRQLAAGNYLLAFSVFIIGLAIFLGPDIYKFQKRKNTAYIATNKAVYFKLWKMGRQDVYRLGYEDIDRFHIVEFKDGSGTIHFMPNKPIEFKTRDLKSGSKRHQPTYEYISQVKEVSKQLHELKAKS